MFIKHEGSRTNDKSTVIDSKRKGLSVLQWRDGDSCNGYSVVGHENSSHEWHHRHSLRLWPLALCVFLGGGGIPSEGVVATPEKNHVVTHLMGDSGRNEAIQMDKIKKIDNTYEELKISLHKPYGYQEWFEAVLGRANHCCLSDKNHDLRIPGLDNHSLPSCGAESWCP